MTLSPELKRGFNLLRDGNVDGLLAELGSLGDGGQALRPFLPYLVRVAWLRTPESDSSGDAIDTQCSILAAIADLEAVNSIVTSLAFDREALKQDIEKEKLLRAKQTSSGGAPGQESVLVQSLERPLEVEFEQAHSTRKLRLFMCELLRLVTLVQGCNGEWFPISNALFDSALFFHDIVDLLHLALTELHSLVSCEEVAGVLLRLEHGSEMLVQLAAGMPHFYQSFLDTVVECTFRCSPAEQSQAWRACSHAMLALCGMDSPQAMLRTRQLCVEAGGPACCMLLLTDELAKHYQDMGDLRLSSGVWLDFITSILLQEKSSAKDSLVEYVHMAQKKNARAQKANPAFESLLENILQELLSLFMASHPQTQLLGVMSGTSADQGMDSSVSEMVIDEGNGRDSSLAFMRTDADGSLVHEEVMDIGMPVGGGSANDSLNDGFTDVEELPFQSSSVAMLNDADEDLLKQFDGSALSLDASVVSLAAAASGAFDMGARALLQLPENETTRGCRLLQSFCALVGVANLRLSGEQTEPLVQLITARPPFTKAGSRFVELALCTLLICPSLTGDIEHSRCVVDWLRWLLKEQATFDRALGSHVPYGELLLLVAIHYHGGELERIVELVRMVLGINIILSSSRLIAVKMLFTQDVFTEKVVIEQAVQVGVTPTLSSHLTHYLPVHCLLELLQTRSFARHASQLKEWIYRQLLNCTAPVHALVPQLLEEFVKTLIMPIQGVTPPPDGVHKGFSDSEILAVFGDDKQDSVLYSGARSSNGTSGDLKRTHGQATSATLTAQDSFGRHSIVTPDGNGMDVGDGLAVAETATASAMPSLSPPNARNPVVQLLMLYYVLTYHDCVLANLKKIMSVPTVARTANPVALSPFSLISKLPVKRLVVYARTSPRIVGSLYSRLLRLLVTHLPHLCLTQDWLAEENVIHSSGAAAGAADARSLSTPGRHAATATTTSDLPPAQRCGGTQSARTFHGWMASMPRRRVKLPTPQQLSEAYSKACVDPALCMSFMKRLCALKDVALLVPYLDSIVTSLPKLLGPGVPRVALTSTATLWGRLSSVLPRQLWVGTVNALRQTTAALSGSLTPPLIHAMHPEYTEEDLINNPLLTLSCRRDVFRCPVIFDMVCRVLAAYLAASRGDLTERSRAQVVLAHRRSGGAGANLSFMEHDSEETRSAMCSAQDSLAVQLLIEICAPTEDEVASGAAEEHLGALTEIRGIVSSVLHQMFIDDPSIAKLVHFQGYDERLIPVFMASVPSLYICHQFIPELLTQPQHDKQIFALQLCFHLCSHYPLPDPLKVARSAMSHLSMIISARSLSEYASVFMPVLPALTRACKVLPALLDDAVPLLLRLGQVLHSTCGGGGGGAATLLLSPPLSPKWKQAAMAEASYLSDSGPNAGLLRALRAIFSAV